LNGVIALTFA